MKKLLLLILLFVSYQLSAQVTLTNSPYNESFASLAGGLPTGFSVRTGATASALGTSATLTTAATSWNASGGAFINVAAAALGNPATTPVQAAATDRALGLRQTGAFGDKEAAFVFQIANTTGKSGFKLDFDLQSLDIAIARVATWKVEYGTGTAPTTFSTPTTVGTLTTGNNTFQSNHITVDFGNALDNISDNVWIRIVTLTATTGTGSRPTTAIDNFNLEFINSVPTGPTLGANPSTLSFGNQTTNTVSAEKTIDINYANLDGTDVTVSVAAPFTISKTSGGTFGNSLTYTNAQLSGSSTTFYVLYSPTTATLSSNTLTIAGGGASDATATLTGTGIAPDVTPPANTATFPKISNITSTTLDVVTNIDEAGTSYYVLIPATGIAPTTTAQVLAGQDGNGTAAFKAGSIVNIANTNASANIAGLTAATNYNVYVVAKDAVGTPNVQSAFTTLNTATSAPPPPVTNHVVISEAYGGGGNAGTIYKNDYIELYNPTSAAVDLTGWSVQYNSAAGTGTWQVTALSGIIPAKGFYLVQEAAGAGGILDLPTPDKIGAIAMSGTAGKIILSNSTVALSGANPASADVIDKVGIGAASGFEGTPTLAYSNTTSVERKVSSISTVSSLSAGGSEEFDGNGYDTDNNSTDFIVNTPNPQNSTAKEPTGATHLVISEVYGGGGNGGSVYTHDFIELYNPTINPIDLTGWSVQYNSAAGASTWQVTPLSGTIAAKSFYLVQEAIGANGTTALPTADKVGSIAMAAGAGKVLLANVTAAQTGGSPAGAAIIDFVGYGLTASAYEGTGPAPVPSATISVERKASAASTSTTMDINGTDEGNGNGYDSDDNAFDFVARAANPQNSAITEPAVRTGPYIVTSPKSIVFKNQAINTVSDVKIYQISSGNITDPLTVTTSAPFSISKDNITYSTSLNYTVANLAANQFVYVKFSPTTLGNNSGTISHVSNGATTTNVTLSGPGIDPAQTSFTFEDCVTIGSPALSDGFYQYSVTGAQTWGCTTTYGHKAGDATNLASEGNALQMNGYSSGNVPNEDWLISPALNLSSMTYAVLSFWTRSAFEGNKLQLKVSTNYTGSGDPSLATWTTIDGKFPGTSTDIWTKSDYIDLSAYKALPVYVAFVYTSTSTSASRWTIDDFAVTNSATPPPVDLTVSTSSLYFGYQTAGTTSTEKSFSFSAGNITGDVTLTAPANFTIASTSGGTYGTTLTYPLVSTLNTSPVVYAKFAPSTANVAYSNNVVISTAGSADKTVNFGGNSFLLTNTLEVVNWNIEWFGSTVNGPSNKATQAANVRTVVNNLNADIYGFAEVVDTASFRLNVLPAGYNVIFSDFGSYADDKNDNGVRPNHSYNDSQKLAFMYRTDIVKPIQTFGVLRDTYYPALTNDADGTPYKNWSSGRFPFLMEAKVLVNGAEETVYFIEIHAKANTGDVTAQNDAYDRRKGGNAQFKAWIDANLPGKKVIILGDFNDVLDPNKTIAPKPGGTGTSYSDFTLDAANYFPVTLPLSLAGKRSTAGFNTVIDNVILNKTLNDNYISNSAEVLDNVVNLVANYSTTTTDHYPIQSRYFFTPSVLPISLSAFTATASGNNVVLKWTTASETRNQYFTVERSKDGKNFIALKQVKGAGTSTIINNYNSIDENPLQGVNYYRIKQTDEDGKSTYSYLRSATILSAKTNDFTIYPNPVTDKITLGLSTSSTSVNLIVSGLDGRVIFNETASLENLNEKLNAKLPTLIHGVYIVKLTADGQAYTSKFIKQ